MVDIDFFNKLVKMYIGKDKQEKEALNKQLKLAADKAKTVAESYDDLKNYR